MTLTDRINNAGYTTAIYTRIVKPLSPAEVAYLVTH